jgi:hypothetical protein
MEVEPSLRATLVPSMGDLTQALQDLARDPGERSARQRAADRALDVARALMTRDAETDRPLAAANTAAQLIAGDIMVSPGYRPKMSMAPCTRARANCACPSQSPRPISRSASARAVEGDEWGPTAPQTRFKARAVCPGRAREQRVGGAYESDGGTMIEVAARPPRHLMKSTLTVLLVSLGRRSSARSACGMDSRSTRSSGGAHLRGRSQRASRLAGPSGRQPVCGRTIQRGSLEHRGPPRTRCAPAPARTRRKHLGLMFDDRESRSCCKPGGRSAGTRWHIGSSRTLTGTIADHPDLHDRTAEPARKDP